MIMGKALQEYRRRLAERGYQRVELCVSAADADLLRRVARALANDDEAARRLRKALQDKAPIPVKFKDWLTSLADDEHVEPEAAVAQGASHA